jgi:FkbM family methyltransferase
MKINKIYNIEKIPLSAKLYMTARKHKADSIYDKLIIVALLRAQRIINKISYFSRFGIVVWKSRNKAFRVQFDGKNLQYRALYLPVYKNGYETSTLYAIKKLLKGKGVFYDVGSNWGYYSLCIASDGEFTGSVHAFEPNKNAFGDLKRMAQELELENIINTNNIGLGSLCKKMYVAPKYFANTGNTRLLDNSNYSNALEVDVATIDSLNIDCPDVIKIDVEGMELDVLMGGVEKIRRAHPYIIFESWLPVSKNEKECDVLSWLHREGYEFFIPGLMYEDNGSSQIVITDDEIAANIRGNDNVNVICIEINHELRSAYRSHINIIACHTSKVDSMGINKIGA